MKPATLPLNEIRFFSSASPAHNARLFEWNEEMYRAVSEHAVPFFQQLLSTGTIENLVKKNLLVETERCPLHVDGAGMVLKHRRIPFVTYGFEWAAPALRDAALLWIDLNLELGKNGLGTIDAHPWNILFDGSRPLFIDIGSLAPLDSINVQSVVSEFKGYFLYPLQLMAAQQRRIARSLLRDCVNPVSADEFRFLNHKGSRLINEVRTRLSTNIRGVPAPVKKLLRPVRGKIREMSEKVHGSRQVHFQRMLEGLRSEISSIELSSGQSPWLEYYEGFADFDSRQDWTPKQAVVDEVFSRIKPKTLVDIGSNAGWYSRLAVRHGSQVIALEADEACLDRLYIDASKEHLYLIPLSMDLRNPSPAYGWSGTRYKSAPDRLKADCVLALALIHHLVFRQLADFALIVDALSQFTRKSLLVEFISKEDRYVREWWNEGFAWYTLENFLTALRARFRNVAVVSPESEARILILCEK
jgi:hypothetical protein